MMTQPKLKDSMQNSSGEGGDLKFLVFNLFVFSLAIYLLTASGLTLSDVGELRTDVARSIVESFDLSVPVGNGMVGADGREYSWFGIGSVLAALPFYIAGKAAGGSPEHAVCMMNQFAGAATVVLVFLFTLSLGYTRRSSLAVSLFYGLGTMAWYYTKDSGDHALETFSILLSFYGMYRFSSGGKTSNLLISSLAIGFASLVRPTSVLAMPSLLLLLLAPHLNREGFKGRTTALLNEIALFSCALIPFAAVSLWYNRYRFGSLFETGYNLMAARLGAGDLAGTPLLTGLMGLLASSWKGLFFFSPVTILFFLAIRPFRRKHPLLSLCFITAILSWLLFYAKYVYWHGGTGWGPRFLLAVTPFLVIPMAELLAPLSRSKGALSGRGIFALFALSVAIQLASVSVNSSRYYIYLQTEKNIRFMVTRGEGVQPIIEPPPEVYYDWRISPIVSQFAFIGEMAAKLRDYRYTEPGRDAPYKEMIRLQPWMNTFDFWWLYKYFADGSRFGFFAALALLSLIFYTATMLTRAIR